MKKALLAAVTLGCFTFGMIGMAQATIEVNVAGDGFEDLIYNGVSYNYDQYQNSGTLVGEVLTGNFESNLYTQDGTLVNLESYVSDFFNWNDFTLTSSTADINVQGWDYVNQELDDLGSTVDGKVDVDAEGYYSGTWSVSPEPLEIGFYAVKAANYFALYYVNPSAAEGSWSVFDLWEAGAGSVVSGATISHFSGFNSTTGTAPVPEPATMLLFGTGLAGLVGFRMRKNKK